MSTENPNFEQTEQGTVLPTRSTRRKMVTATLLFCWGMIVYIIVKGDPTNSLHTSALAWLFFSWLAAIGSYVFGAAWENNTIQGLFKNDKNSTTS
jgi:ABC-type antimicrobial peptide transport system permease subunit